MKCSIRTRIQAIFLAFVLCLTNVAPAFAEKASTMQISQVEGNVSVTTGAGNPTSAWAGMRLYSGYTVSTAAKSYAWITLDNSKVCKLDANSRVEVRQSGSKLELLVHSGSVYCNVSKPLGGKDSMNIRTSSMVMGVRGSDIITEVEDQGVTVVKFLDGAAEYVTYDASSGESITGVIRGGDKVTFIVDPSAVQGRRCLAIRDRLAAGDINGYVLVYLAEHPDIRAKIEQEIGWKLPIDQAIARINQDEAVVASKQAEIDKQVSGQKSEISGSTSGEQPPASSSRPSGGGGGGGSSSDGGGDSDWTPVTPTPTPSETVSPTPTPTPGEAVSPTPTPSETTCTLTYNYNYGEGATSPDPTQVSVVSGKTVGALPETPTRTGWTFKEWNTQSDGTGTKFTAETAISGDMTVYAIWSAVLYTVTYDYNYGEGETSPNPTQVTVASGETVASLPETPTRTGWIFKEWNTQPDGTGTKFTAETTVSGDVTIYAIWSSVYYTVTYDYNYGEGETSPDPMQVTVASGGTVASLPETPTRTDWTFKEWNTQPNGTGTKFTAETAITGDVTFYAIWSSVCYTVTYDYNYGEGETSPDPTPVSVVSGETVESLLEPTREGWTFQEWNTQSEGTGTKFTAEIPITEDITVYAIWKRNIVFDANGGNFGADEAGAAITTCSVPVSDDDKLVLPSSRPERANNSFIGWTTAKNNNATFVTEGDAVTGEWDTLYAYWEFSMTGDFQVISTSNVNAQYDAENHILEIKVGSGETELTLENYSPYYASTDRIVVNFQNTNSGNDLLHITLDGVNIDLSEADSTTSRASGSPAFQISSSGGEIVLTLKDGVQNTLISGAGCAALQVEGGSLVKIEGGGALTLTGGTGCAGLQINDGSFVEIDGSGVLTVAGGDGGTGIGLSSDDDTVAFSGGTLKVPGNATVTLDNSVSELQVARMEPGPVGSDPVVVPVQGWDLIITPAEGTPVKLAVAKCSVTCTTDTDWTTIVVNPEYAVTFVPGKDLPSCALVTTQGKLTSWPEDSDFTAAGWVFQGWNTEENGTGDAFTQETSITEDITVYGVWSPCITFYANMSPDSLSDSSSWYDEGENGELTPNCTILVSEDGKIVLPETPPVWTGTSATPNVFIGWNTVGDGTGTFVNAGDPFDDITWPSGNTNHTLYAHWVESATGAFLVTDGSGNEVNPGSGAILYENHVLKVLPGVNVTIQNRESSAVTQDRIELVADDADPNNTAPPTVTLAGVNIDLSQTGSETDGNGEAALVDSFKGAAITLANGSSNILKSGYGRAGLEILETLEISGTGSLNAAGGGTNVAPISLGTGEITMTGGTLILPVGTTVVHIAEDTNNTLNESGISVPLENGEPVSVEAGSDWPRFIVKPDANHEATFIYLYISGHDVTKQEQDAAVTLTVSTLTQQQL